MRTALDALAIVTAGGGLVVLALSLPLRARWRSAIPIAMELWTAAGLLRLAGDPSLTRVLTAATIIAIRKLVLSRFGRSP